MGEGGEEGEGRVRREGREGGDPVCIFKFSLDNLCPRESPP